MTFNDILSSMKGRRVAGTTFDGDRCMIISFEDGSVLSIRAQNCDGEPELDWEFMPGDLEQKLAPILALPFDQSVYQLKELLRINPNLINRADVGAWMVKHLAELKRFSEAARAAHNAK